MDRREYQRLVARLREYDYAYYVEGEPRIPDAEYDRLFRRVQEWEEAHPEQILPESPTQRVGAPLPEGSKFERVRHAVPMISLESLFSFEEVREWHTRVLKGLEGREPPVYALEPKWDGVSASLIYEDGLLVRGVSRGDGTWGEDLTRNLKAVGGVPLRIRARKAPPLLEVRGEVLMPVTRFEALNRELEKQGEPVFANPRNSTAGTLKRLDPAIVASRGLRFQAWELTRAEGLDFERHSEQMDALREWGFPVSELRELARDPEAIRAWHAGLEERRAGLDFETDGIVVKVDQLALRAILGSRARTPRWACAWKFAPVEDLTILLDVEVQVGRTGRLTPRAVLEPVRLGGTTVRHATLHNFSYIRERDIRIGDTVRVRRAGDVIPQVLGPVPERRTGRERPVPLPARCPSCGGEVTERGEYLLCLNLECPAQLQRRILHLASRNALRIEGLGEKAVARFLEAGLLQRLEDLFALDDERIAALEGWGEKSAQALREQVEAARSPEWPRFLYALGIPEVGEETARALARRFPDLASLLETVDAEDALDRLQEVEGVGPEVASSVVDFLRSKRNRETLENLERLGVRPRPLEAATEAREGVAGRSFVLTGTLSRPRAEVKAAIEAAGGKVASSVSRKTDYVVVGEDPGSKARKAEELAIPILDEETLRRMLGA